MNKRYTVDIRNVGCGFKPWCIVDTETNKVVTWGSRSFMEKMATEYNTTGRKV